MRQYLVLKAESLVDVHDNFEAIRERTIEILRDIRPAPPRDLINSLKRVEVVATPSLGFRSTISDDPGRGRDQQLSELVISYEFPDPQSIQRLRHYLWEHLGDLQEPADVIVAEQAKAIVRNIGADPLVHICDHFPCAQMPVRAFGNRSRVREMMGVGALRDLKGSGVNVVIIDQGLNKAEIETRHPARWGGGLMSTTAIRGSGGRTEMRIEPGSAPPTSHGMMIARNILDIAPEVTLYDVPLIPPHITRANIFASTAHATFKAIVEKICQLRNQRGPNSAWILVNAWAIFDRSAEHPPGDYTRNARKIATKVAPGKFTWELGHPLNRLMQIAVDAGIDVVFGAGNCGQFTSSARCGKHDRGEGRSIWGANAHPAVLTVGAVSANAQWLGYSSQGPAPWGDAEKPDVCTPSHFYEDNDPSRVNSGTSAATGLAAGVIAAVRGNAAWGPDKLSPRNLKDKINAAARGPNGKWNNRMGNGVLNARALLRELTQPAATAAQPR
jgi:hypothetical protein